MKRSTALILVSLVFLAGVAVGGLGARLLWLRADPLALRPPGPGGDFFAERLKRRLDLTPEQAEQIAAIVDETRVESQAMMDRVRPEVGALRERSHLRIEQVLRPEQRDEFRRLVSEQGRRAEYFLLGHGAHHGRGGRHRRPGAPGERRRGGPPEPRLPDPIAPADQAPAPQSAPAPSPGL